MKVALTGASGFVGLNLQNTFENCVIINRHDSEDDILTKLHDIDVVINLAGAPIVKKWTQKYKKILIDSRVESTKKLVSAINKSNVKHFISTSAIGAYPDDSIFDESYTEYANDFLGQLTKEWELEANKCSKPTSILRFGVILGKEGGALAKMLPPFRIGLGGIIGNGKMMTSWIDITDLMSIYTFLIDKQLTGVFNAVSPTPVTNYMFTKALGSALNRATIFPLPEFVLKLIFGEGSTVLTGSKEIYPTALINAGFEFKHKNIESSLNHLLG